MATLTQPDVFKGGEPVYKFLLINSPPSIGGGSTEYALFTVPPSVVAVVRFCNAIAIGNGSMGTYSASLYGLYPFGLDTKLGYGGELVSACPVNFASGGQCRITWSTDVDAAYDNADANWERVAQVPIPDSYLPAGTVISINYLPAPGSDAAPYIDFAQLIVELYNPASLTTAGQGNGGDVYLLPQTI